MNILKRLIKKMLRLLRGVADPFTRGGRFRRRFKKNLADCTWQPHPEYSVFMQWDQDFYLSRRSEFLHKYRSFHTISKTAAPRKIIEMGTHAGSGADAYLSGAPGAKYVGYDTFGEVTHEVTGQPWRPYEVAEKLLTNRGYEFRLVKVDLRELDRLPETADFVVVDAAHDFENAYADLRLALTADPKYIWVDDCEGTVASAVAKFLRNDARGRVAFTAHFEYIFGGGRIIELKNRN